MVGICCISNCPSSTTDDARVSFHRFPQANKQSQQLHRRKWLNAIQRDDVPSLAQICSLHFCATDFRRTKARVILSRGAIPTQHLPQSYGRHHHQTAIFRNCCRFCLEPNNAESIRIIWTAWPHSEYSKIYEDITHLKFPVSVNCSEYCCIQCIDRLHETLKSIHLFRNAFHFWQNHIDSADEKPEFAAAVCDGNIANDDGRSLSSDAIAKDLQQDVAFNNKLLDVQPASGGLWPCTHCNLNKKSKVLLLRHIRNVHFPHLKQFECVLCQKRFYSRGTLRYHSLIHKRTSSTIVECKICHKVFADQLLLRKHDRIVHSPIEPVECQQCGQNFASTRQLKVHRDLAHHHHDNVVKQNEEKSTATAEKFQCDICKKLFNNKIAMQRHIKSVHSKYQRFMCDGCAASFYTMNGLKRHLPRCNRQHSYRPRVQHNKRQRQSGASAARISCRLCSSTEAESDMVFDNKMLLRQHYNQEHAAADGGMDTVCIWCNTKFEFAHQLQQHLSEPMVHCIECRKRPKCPTTLAAHRQQHLQAGQNNPCDLCQKAFISPKTMKRHKRMVHLGERRFKCDECDKAFFDRTHLKTHQKSHYRQRNQVVAD